MYLRSHATCTCKRHASPHVWAHVALKNIGWNFRKPCCETHAACSAHVTHVITAEQAKLVVEHMRIVEPICKRLVKRFGLPFWIDLEEMVSCGYVGLVRAALKFDPARGKFETYATFRIRGHVIDDFLRRHAPITLPMRDHPERSYEDGESTSDYREPEDPTQSVEDTLMAEQAQERRCRHLSFAFAQLGEVELRIVRRKHMDGWTLKQISEAEQRSNAWVHSQVRAGAEQLREALIATAAESKRTSLNQAARESAVLSASARIFSSSINSTFRPCSTRP